MSALPTEWRLETLSALASGGLFSDGDWVESKDQDPQGSVRLTQLADVGVAEFRDRSDRWLREDQASRLGCTFLEPGDVLIARMPDPLGRACLVPDGIGRAITVVDVAIARPTRDDLDPRFLMWALNGPDAHSQMTSMQSGTTRKRISRKNLGTVRLPVPPLDEQRRIVDILEDHLSRLDAGAEFGRRARLRLGSLVHSTLLASPEISGAPPVALAELLERPLANGRSVKTLEGGFPVLRLTALGGPSVDLNARKAGDWTGDEARPFLVRRGDFLVARGNGSLELVARGATVVGDPDPVAFPDTMIRIRTRDTEVDRSYFAAIWNSRIVRTQVESIARTTAGIYKVNQAQLNRILLPLPPLAAQGGVARRLADASDASARGRQAIDETVARSARLRRALLAAAFSGRLTGHASDLDRAEEAAG